MHNTFLAYLKKAVTPAAALVAAVTLATSTPTVAAPCAVGPLSDYVSAGSCTVGGVTLSDFVVEPFPGATTQIDPAAVSLSPIAGGFTILSDPLTALAGELLGLRFLFHVEGVSPLGGGSIALGPDRDVTPDGNITALFSAGPLGDAIAFDIGIDAEPAASFVAAPSSFFDVFVEIGIDGGPSGEATIGPTLASVTVTSVPEPPALALAALLLATTRRRRGARAES